MRLIIVLGVITVTIPLLLLALRGAGVWLLVDDPLPEKVDVIFTFAGEKYRVDYSAKLMIKYPGAHWVLSDFKNGYFNYIRKKEFDISRITLVDTCVSTISEVKCLFGYLREQRGQYPKNLTVGLVSSPYHMRRINLMVKSQGRMNNVKFTYLPVPLEAYNASDEMYKRWWKNKYISEVVFSEFPKILYFYFFNNK
jgi:uncharacterized SAM-binding protein YcdF (DUF218 family)